MSLINAIQANEISLINDNLSKYKERGITNPILVIKEIPFEDRMPQLVKKSGRYSIAVLLNVLLTTCFEKMNLRLSMNASQIVELAEQIIDSSEEDQLALEDIMLFLQQLIKGETGKIYDRMDIPTFFEMFEKYREKRHQDYVSAKDEYSTQCKTMPINTRLVDMFGTERGKHREALKDYLIINHDKTGL